MSENVKEIKKSKKKILLLNPKFLRYIFSAKKNNINKNVLRFSILGIYNSTRALQSSPILRQKFWKHFKKSQKKICLKNAIILVLLIEEISLRPELTSPPRFRFQGIP